MKWTVTAIGSLFLFTGVQIDHPVTMGVGAAIVAFGLLRGGVK